MAQEHSQVIYNSSLEATAFSSYHQLSNVLVLWEDKVLLLRRLTEPFKGFWSVPGGGVNANEQYVDAAQRELGEEVGINATALEPLYIFVDHVHHMESHVYSCTSTDGAFVNREADEHEVVTWKRIEDALKLPLTPGVHEALERLSQLR